MTVPTRRIHLDFETGSRADLKKVGAFRYAQDPSTFVLCLAYREHPVVSTVPRLWLPGDPDPSWLAAASRGEIELHAYNAQFEWAILNYTCTRLFGWPVIPIHAMRCTLARARYWGYSGRLEDTARALGGAKKDKEGHALMLRMSRPRKRKGQGDSWWHEDDPERYQRLQEYCQKDVIAEQEIADKLPPLPQSEQILFEHDLAINADGVRVDTDLVEKLGCAILREQERLDRRMECITHGAVPTTRSPAKLRDWVLAAQPELAPVLPDLQKDTLKEILDPDRVGLQALPRLALETRQIAAKTSVKKIPAMAQAVCEDGRIRGILQYYGAARTGRWAGRIVQPQNLPRGEIPKGHDVAALADEIACGWRTPEQVAHELGIEPLTLVSGLVRACLVPDDFEQGGIFLAPDYGQIEARVIAWLGGQNDVLEVFRQGRDIYAYTAAQVTKGPEPDKSDPLRQYGKVIVLGTGFGMGPPKFRETARKSGVILTEREAREAVYGWRDANPRITGLWRSLRDTVWALLRAASQKANILQMTVPGTRGKLSMRLFPAAHDWREWTLAIRLPSGRELVYPGIAARPHPYRPGENALTYWGVDQITGKWTLLDTYGGKLAENVTQACARDVMAWAIVRLTRHGYVVKLTVHDEIVVWLPSRAARTTAEIAQHCQTVEQHMRFETKTPGWMSGLPLAVEATPMRRYRK